MCVKPLVGTQLSLSSFIRQGDYQNTHKDFTKKWQKKITRERRTLGFKQLNIVTKAGIDHL